MKEDIAIAVISGVSVGCMLKYICHFHDVPLGVIMLVAGVGSLITSFVVKRINR